MGKDDENNNDGYPGQRHALVTGRNALGFFVYPAVVTGGYGDGSRRATRHTTLAFASWYTTCLIYIKRRHISQINA